MGIGASSSTSSPASEDDADLAAVTARCIISRTPNLDAEPPLLAATPPLLRPLPLEMFIEPAVLLLPDVVVPPSESKRTTMEH